MAVIILDVCSRCKTDISRRLGVITKPTVTCSNCGHQMLVTRSAILNNWQYNGVMWPFFAIWAGMAITVLFSPQIAADIGRNAKMPSHTFGTQVILAVLAFFPAIFCALPFALIGRIIGHYVAQRLYADAVAASASAPSGPAGREMQSQRWMSSSPGRAPGVDPYPTMPGEDPGSRLLSGFAWLVWCATLFIVGALVISLVVSAGVTEAEAQQRAAETAGRAFAVPLFVASMILATVFVKLGWFPGLSRKAA